jgi:septal ring factor EnvC (AmiA/AmiB activator)
LACAIVLSTSAFSQTVDQERAALALAERQAAAANVRATELEASSVHANDAAEKAKAQAAAVAARIQAGEAGVAAARAKVDLIDRLQRQQRADLAAKQAPISKLLAALQMMARRPSALALVQPGSLDDIVHLRAALTTALPVIRERSAGLRAEIAEADRLRSEAAAAAKSLADQQRRLSDLRSALSRLEAAQRLQASRLSNAAIYQQDRATAMGVKARDIGDLIDQLQLQARVREELIQLDGPVLRPITPGESAWPPQEKTGDTQPMRVHYRMPVVGRLITGFGEVSRTGFRSRGLTVVAEPRAQVIAPLQGQISYAGRFRDYGSIVIVDHGHGWTTLITGLESLAVHVGDTVDAGSPLGRASEGDPKITVELRHGVEAIDIMPFFLHG